MTAKKPGKGKKKAAARRSFNPFLLALAAVGLVFAVAFGASALLDMLAGGPQAPRKPAGQVAQVTVPAPPAPVPVPPPPALRDVPAAPAPAMPPPAESPRAEAPAGPAVPEPHKPEPHRPEPVKPEPAKPQEASPAPVPEPLPVPPPGTPAWQKNAVAGAVSPDHPAIAIVIDDMGLDRKRSKRTVQLPGPLTLAWIPYAQDLAAQTRAARAAGHELLLHMPMQPQGNEDPGPGALLVGLGREEIQKRFRTGLDSFEGFVGVNNHMGSRFTADRESMAPVIAEIQRRGLLWLDSRTTPKSAGIGLAQEMKVPFAGRDVFLDNEMTVGAVRAQLAKTEQVARQQGYAVAIGHPHDATIQALADWLPELRKRGFALVPVSAVVRARSRTPGG
ncbi:divergent polysaccharide deacetylase family protein [Azospirillum sp. SYSU D00513]|uniref:divergent polysaccharide deacetylase family protein n=1 Tax=Azospirillum sp. SYSU D00513 TaxID=2812561 RepID=UPI001A968B14|nr:divergent polysaccharide deacetylase family protein [Azospirillum sp. SYSU D00513]